VQTNPEKGWYFMNAEEKTFLNVLPEDQPDIISVKEIEERIEIGINWITKN